MALISLEDLEGLDEEQLDDDITEDPQPMAEEEEDRLLTHWQAVASNHQVLVPPGEGGGGHHQVRGGGGNHQVRGGGNHQAKGGAATTRSGGGNHQVRGGAATTRSGGGNHQVRGGGHHQVRGRQPPGEGGGNHQVLVPPGEGGGGNHQLRGGGQPPGEGVQPPGEGGATTRCKYLQVRGGKPPGEAGATTWCKYLQVRGGKPPEMMGPIMEMTRNSQQRELLPFSSICCHEKMGEVQFEERLIPPDGEKLFEQSVSVSFMKLMRYICRENSTGRFLGLTVPVVTEVSADGLSMQEVVRTSFFLPSEFQSTPPLPSDPDITIVQREPIRVLSRTFFGTTTWQTLTYQVGILRSLLGAPPLLGTPPLLGAPPLLGGPPLLGSPPLLGAPPLLENFMVASYENPSVPERRNEIWILPRDL
ncbi:hypothetical protein NQZ68_035424 [Dissostichus eleginoides]|nr:hypothetical protein NQZ68_035424 [Dissostichus eleginoides]